MADFFKHAWIFLIEKKSEVFSRFLWLQSLVEREMNWMNQANQNKPSKSEQSDSEYSMESDHSGQLWPNGP
jgi:hypothetical protein